MSRQRAFVSKVKTGDVVRWLQTSEHAVGIVLSVREGRTPTAYPLVEVKWTSRIYCPPLVIEPELEVISAA